MNLWLRESKNGINNEKKMSVAACSSQTSEVYFGGAAGTNFLESYLENIPWVFIFVNLTKMAETAKTPEHQYH